MSKEDSGKRIHALPPIGKTDVQMVSSDLMYVRDGQIDSQTIYHQKELGLNYSRLEVRLVDCSVYAEGGKITATSGDVHFKKLDLGLKSLITGYTNKNKGDDFFTQELVGNGHIWLSETTSYLTVLQLNNEKVTLEAGVFYAAVGKFDMRISSDISIKNIVMSSKDLINIDVVGTGYVILELPVDDAHILRIPINSRTPARVDRDLVMYRKGSVKRTATMSSGIVSSVLNKTGFLDKYEGNGFIYLAPTLDPDAYMKQYIKPPENI